MAAADPTSGPDVPLHGLVARVLQDAPVLIVVLDLQGRIQYVNPFFERLTGYPLHEALGRNWFETLLPERDRAQIRDVFARSTGGQHVRGHVNPIVARSGEERQIEWTDEFLRNEAGESIAILAIGQDVSDRHSAQQDLLANEERLRILIESTPAGVAMLDRDLRYIACSRRWIADYRLEGQTVVGRRHYDVFPEIPDRWKEMHRRSLNGESMRCDEDRFERADGSVQYLRWAIEPWHDRTGAVGGVIFFTEDITEHKRVELTLRADEERLRILIESTPAGVAMLDRDLRYIACSRRWIADYGLQGQAVVGRLHYEIFPEITERWKQIHRQCLAGVPQHCDEDRFERADGSVQFLRWAIEPWRDASGAVGGVIFFTEDITEHKRLEAQRAKLQEQLRQAQKMESLGRLAGGIAHDFNNLLGVVVASAELARRAAPAEGPVRGHLDDIATACARATELVKQILAFSRKQPARRVTAALRPVLEEVARLLRATLPAGIQVTLKVVEPVPDVLIDGNQIHQVLMNLATNAAQAIDRASGTIALRLDAVVVEAGALPVAGLSPGLHARIQVADDGGGIPAALLDRIFEPFFTTKGVGQGTGLGLAVAHGIVCDHGGGIAVLSTPDAGSTFSVYLPASAAAHARVAPPAATPAPPPMGRVLLIDDEELLLRVETQLVERLGYSVQGFARAADALAALRAAPADFDVVLTDQHMPEVGGLEVAREVATIRADLPVVLVSGNRIYTEAELEAANVSCCLDKPFALAALGEVLARSLGRA